jgi:hypothetical protein
MRVEGDDKLIKRIDDAKWFLNENLDVPECRGDSFDEENPGDDPVMECECCNAYINHVGTDFAKGEGSLKVVFLGSGNSDGLRC